MSRCRTLSIVALTGCLFLTSAAGLHAQSDAETALENARVAYQADQFEAARNQAKQASQTAATNPDVWLLLGKAHFQLGELDEALVAWRNLLKLAPNHVYGRRMVSALEGQTSDIDVRIRLASLNVGEGFLQTARTDLQLLRTRSPLSVEQRRKVLMLLAEVAVLEVKGTDALAIINELTTRDADAAGTLPVRLLTARAQLATGGAFTTFGLAGLAKIVEESADTPDGQVAQLELLLHRVSRGEDGVAELAAWIEENGTLTASRRARIGLRDSVQRYLTASAATPAPKDDAELNEHDKSALTAAGHAFKAFVDVADQTALAAALTTHLEKRYVGADAFAAARSGLALIDQMPLLAAVREVVAGSRRRIEVAETTFEFMQIKEDVREAVAGPEVLAKWIADHAGHPMELEARETLVTAYLDVTRRMPAPAADAELSAPDKLAIAAVGAIESTAEVSKLLQLLTQHFQKHYFDRGAHAAAIAGVEALVPLEVPARRAPLVAVVAGMQRDIATLEYTRISRDVGATIASPDDLSTWITDHADHPKAQEARRSLVLAYLNATRLMGAPEPGATLSESDQKALTVAAEYFTELKTPAEISKLVEVLTQHFQKQYFANGATEAAIAGIRALLPLEVPVKRASLLNVLLGMQIQVALAELRDAVAAGTVPAGAAPMPASLQAAAATAVLISTNYPATPAWGTHAQLGIQVLDTAAAVPWPTRITGPKAAHGWALRLALPVVTANSDADSVKVARGVVDRVVNELAALKQPTAAGLATTSHARLLAVIPQESDLWPQVAFRHVDLLAADASRTFDANIRSGEAVKNAKLTETQEAILTLLSDVVKQRPALAVTALQRLGTHLQKWSAARHDVVVEAAYESFAADLPPVAQRQTRLAIARLWFNQVLREHGRILANGFQVPRALDERSQKALQQCYQMAAVLGAGDPLLADIRALRMQIVDHYLALEFEDIAEAAIKVKVDPGNADLDESAELELAGLKRRVAERQLARQLKQHNGRKQIVLTPAFNEAIAALKKFITDHPTSDRVPVAADGVFVIGRRFEQYEAWLLSAQIYADFELFAAKIESLTQVRPGQSTYPERAAIARASTLHTRASRALQEWNTAKPDDTPPPDALSDEFQAAQAAWQKVIADYQQRPVAQTAIARIMGIAQEYAGLNAWDVADATYAALLGLELPLRSPERLEFGRAICQLGKVLPDHARSVLAALAVTGTGLGDDDKAGGRLRSDGLLGALSMLESLNMGRVTSKTPSPDPANELQPPAVEAPAASAPGEKGGPQPGTPSPVITALEDRSKKLDAITLDGSGGVAGGGFAYDSRFRRAADAQLMAAVRTQLDRQAQQVAMLRDNAIGHRRPGPVAGKEGDQKEMPAQQSGQQGAGSAPVLSDAELERQQQVLDAVYAALQAIRQKYAESATAEQSRDEIFVIVNHWRQIAQWDRAALLARKFLTDNPTDIQLPKIRQEIARDWLAWASMGVRDPALGREELLSEIARRFDTAREELQAIIVAFPDETAVRHQAQWDVANSFLTQARVVIASSPTLARGQFVRAATELLRVAELFHDHPQIGSIPDMLWGISNELAGRKYHDEAISVWNELQIHYPTHALADQSALRTAQTWQQVGQPLRAVEAFLELNFARGGTDAELQNTIYQTAVSLKNEKRWIESLHVLQTFVDSFPSHANAGQSLTMIGQIHQTNEVWEDAISAYSRVIDEFPTGTWTTEARWSIAECTINLSLWHEAMGAYAEFQRSYPKDGRVAEAARRIEVLKTLDRYQDVIDEEGQRKAFDAQFQVAALVRTQLTNPVKAIIEYRKVAKNWPQSHLADDALFEIGKIYLELGETERARTALLQSAERYPDSPLADDALLLVGTSYVSEANLLAAVDRGKSQEIAKDIAQKQAYAVAQDNVRRQTVRNLDQVTALKAQGKREEAANKEAYFAGQALQFAAANTLNVSNWAANQEEMLSAAQLADRQDKINASLRKAVESFRQAASVSAADKADDALLQMAQIYDERLKDSAAAMSTWEEIVKQYSGTDVAEDASWKMASYLEGQKQHAKAITAYQTFFRNYRRSPRAGQAQAAIAENYEHLGEWVQAMDAYTNYVNNFPEGPLLKKARDQISWIKTYRL